MNISVDTVTDNVTVSAELGGLSTVGASLNDARKKNNMRLDEAAKQLRLGTDIVYAIENGLTDELPGMAFTRGYVRSYAKLLGLNEEQILSELGGMPDDIKIHLTQNKPIHYRKQYPVGKWLQWIALFCVVAGLIVLAIPVAERLLTNDLEVQSDIPKLIIPGQSNIGNSLPLIANTDVTDSLSAHPELAVKGPSADSNVAGTPQSKTLVLSVRQDCWIEVKYSGKKQLAGIVRAGQTKTFEATAPVEVLLGNAPAVTVEYDGKVFNHNIYTKGKVARFSLDY